MHNIVEERRIPRQFPGFDRWISAIIVVLAIAVGLLLSSGCSRVFIWPMKWEAFDQKPTYAVQGTTLTFNIPHETRQAIMWRKITVSRGDEGLILSGKQLLSESYFNPQYDLSEFGYKESCDIRCYWRDPDGSLFEMQREMIEAADPQAKRDD